MKRILLSAIIFIFTCANSFAQLAAGDIAFLGMQTDAPDAFAFVTLTDISGNTSISFTDNGWNGSALFTNENTVTWTAPAGGVSTGTVIIIRHDTTATSTSLVLGPGTTQGALSGLSNAGDQILAYTGTSMSPSFIAAISTNLFIETCNTTSGGTNNNNTCLPEPLEEGINAIAVPGDATEADNIFLDFEEFSGSADDIRAFIMNSENWTYDDDPAIAGFDVWPDWAFAFEAVDPSTVTFQLGFLSLDEGAPASTVFLNFSPATSGSQSLQITLSGNTTPSDFSSTPQFEGNNILLLIPSGATSFSFNLAAIADVLAEGTETGTLTISSASPGLVIGAENSLNLEINDPEGQSFVSFTSSTINANEGAGTVTVTIGIAPAASSDGSFSILITENELSSADYTTTPSAVGGIITANFLAGATEFSFDINLIDDSEVEGNESLVLTLDEFSAGFSAGQFGSAVFNVSDNDGVVIVSNLYINEVMASNTNTIADENGEFDDWIEIYNGAASSQDLAGLYITDEISNSTKYQFPTGDNNTIIPAGGFKLVWADNSPAQGALHTNFAISAAGEYVGLYNTTGELIDSITVPALGPDQSYGRTEELSNNWITFLSGATTPNASNASSSITGLSQIAGSVFPSPAADYFSIQLNDPLSNLNIHIFDVQGNLVHAGNSGKDRVIQINCSNWANGIYLVRLGNGKARAYHKIVVAH